MNSLQPRQGNLVWIASYPKSGNTWVRLILRAATRQDMDLSKPDRVSLSFADRVRAYMEMNGLRASDPGETRQHWKAAQEICSTLLESYPPFRAKFLKTHNIAGQFDTGLFPEPGLTAGAIYIIRDPRDVALSMAHHFSIPIEKSVCRLMKQDRVIANAQNRRAELVTDWGTHVRSWLAAAMPARLVLRYEDMLADAESSVVEILKFCGVEPDPGLVRHCLRATRFDALQSAENREGFIEAPRKTFFRAGRSGQWRAENPALFAPIAARYAGLMEKYGYL